MGNQGLDWWETKILQSLNEETVSDVGKKGLVSRLTCFDVVIQS